MEYMLILHCIGSTREQHCVCRCMVMGMICGDMGVRLRGGIGDARGRQLGAVLPQSVVAATLCSISSHAMWPAMSALALARAPYHEFAMSSATRSKEFVHDGSMLIVEKCCVIHGPTIPKPQCSRVSVARGCGIDVVCVT